MMTQLLVPMTYAEQLEQELIQVTAQRDRMLNAIVKAVEGNCDLVKDNVSDSFLYALYPGHFAELEQIATVSP